MKPWVCVSVSAVVALCLLTVDYPAQIPRVELDRLLALASDYVDRYEITVTYAANKALGILVPEEMNETYYNAASPLIVRCNAKYSNFRSFNVDVKSSIDSPANR
jgi:hypothetical protein